MRVSEAQCELWRAGDRPIIAAGGPARSCCGLCPSQDHQASFKGMPFICGVLDSNSLLLRAGGALCMGHARSWVRRRQRWRRRRRPHHPARARQRCKPAHCAGHCFMGVCVQSSIPVESVDLTDETRRKIVPSGPPLILPTKPPIVHINYIKVSRGRLWCSRSGARAKSPNLVSLPRI